MISQTTGGCQQQNYKGAEKMDDYSETRERDRAAVELMLGGADEFQMRVIRIFCERIMLLGGESDGGGAGDA